MNLTQKQVFMSGVCVCRTVEKLRLIHKMSLFMFDESNSFTNGQVNLKRVRFHYEVWYDFAFLFTMCGYPLFGFDINIVLNLCNC